MDSLRRQLGRLRQNRKAALRAQHEAEAQCDPLRASALRDRALVLDHLISCCIEDIAANERSVVRYAGKEHH